jgi:hypothetical protein
VCLSMHSCMRVCVSLHVHVLVCLRACMCACSCVRACMSACVCKCIGISVRVCRHVRVCTCSCVHAHVCASSSLWPCTWYRGDPRPLIFQLRVNNYVASRKVKCVGLARTVYIYIYIWCIYSIFGRDITHTVISGV